MIYFGISERLGRKPLYLQIPFRPEADSAYVQSSFSGLVVTSLSFLLLFELSESIGLIHAYFPKHFYSNIT